MIGVGELLGPIGRGVVLTLLAVLWTLLHVRLVGLRAFSKMTATDFVATVATGSLIAQAGTRSQWAEFAQALAAISGVFLVQWLLAKARQRSTAVRQILSNDPVLLMEHGRFLDKAMAEARVGHQDILENLRQAGVHDLADVRAVILETTGDISVIKGQHLSPEMLKGVERRA